MGELGTPNGPKGMYRYMMEHPIWECSKQVVLSEDMDIFGNLIEKELFVFSKGNDTNQVCLTYMCLLMRIGRAM